MGRDKNGGGGAVNGIALGEIRFIAVGTARRFTRSDFDELRHFAFLIYGLLHFPTIITTRTEDTDTANVSQRDEKDAIQSG
jgi:hypothetical protein